MPSAFLQTLAPNGYSWANCCSHVVPVLDPHGLVAGPWGECMHWAVVYEKSSPGWELMPGMEDAPTAQVQAFLSECGQQAFSSALRRNEELTRRYLAQGNQGFSFHGVELWGNSAAGAVWRENAAAAIEASTGPVLRSVVNGSPPKPAIPSPPPSPPPVDAEPLAVADLWPALSPGMPQSKVVPHHPGAPGFKSTVDGMPLRHRVEDAMQGGLLPGRYNRDLMREGAKIVDDNMRFPIDRPCRDYTCSICFLLVVSVMAALSLYYGREIPQLVTRWATTYEDFPGMACGMEPIETWSDGKTASAANVAQRLEEKDRQNVRVRVFQRGLNETFASAASQADLYDEERVTTRIYEASASQTDHATDSSPRRLARNTVDTSMRHANDVGLFGLTENLRYSEALGVLAGAVSAGEQRLIRVSSDRRLATRWSPADYMASLHRDCERACAAFSACVGFDVIHRGGQASCTYQRSLDGVVLRPTASAPPCSDGLVPCAACWIKVDGAATRLQASSHLIRLLVFALSGSCISVIVAWCFVKFLTIKPSAAIYCATYCAPACMIGLGLLVCGTLAPLVSIAAAIIGLPLVCCGACCCFFTHCCYSQCLFLTIELMAVVASIISKNVSLLGPAFVSIWVSTCWTVASTLVLFGVYAWDDRQRATIPASEQSFSTQQTVYVQCIFVLLFYLWVCFVWFNVCNATFCGVFARWYFGKGSESPMVSSFKVASLTSFGSVCSGSFLIAFFRTFGPSTVKRQNDSDEPASSSCCASRCVTRRIIYCVGDLTHWISGYAYVQVAIRGLSFMPASKATYALATVSKIIGIASGILCSWVVLIFAYLCASVGAIFAGSLTYAACEIDEWCFVMSIIGGTLGGCSGFLAGGSVLAVIYSGAVTILMCWTECPDVLRFTYPDLHGLFSRNYLNTK